MEHVFSAPTVDRNFVSHSVNFLVKSSPKIFVLLNFILNRNNLTAKSSKINRIKMNNKMRPYSRIYYSIVS